MLPHPGCGPASLGCQRGAGAGRWKRILSFSVVPFFIQMRNFITYSERHKNLHSGGNRKSKSSLSGLALSWFNFSWGCAGGGKRWVKAVFALTAVFRRVPLFEAEMETVSSTNMHVASKLEGNYLRC